MSSCRFMCTVCYVLSFLTPVLEVLEARFAFRALSYVCEIAEDGTLLAGVGIE